MPAFTVTSVSTVNDTFTAAGVAATGGAAGTVLQTGDRLRLRNVGGALPAATPSLAAATDYFAIRVDDNNIKVSDTNAHALAGTNIVDLTGSGSGTTTIEFGLPYVIPTALAAAGTQIKSVNDQGVWNALVALYAGTNKRSAFPRTFMPRFLVPGTFTGGNNPVVVGGPLCYNSSGSCTAVFDIPYEDGERLIGFKYWAAGNGTTDLLFGNVNYNAINAAIATFAIWSDSNRAAAWGLVDVGMTTPSPTLVSGNALQATIPINAGGYSIGPCIAIFDRP